VICHKKTKQNRGRANDPTAHGDAKVDPSPSRDTAEIERAEVLQVRWSRHHCHDLLTPSLPRCDHVTAAMLWSLAPLTPFVL
jgi:hypothetical protein